jgi:hypothetical protein
LKLFRYTFTAFILCLLFSCGDGSISFPKTTFDAPFPRRSRDLSTILGNELTLKSGTDTLNLKISGSRNCSFITDIKTGDTLFSGTVCKFRGMYYFSQQLNDSSYWISAVKISGNLIYGLNSAFIQTMLIDKKIESGNYKTLVKYMLSGSIRLHPGKRDLKKLFTEVIDSVPPDTLLHFDAPYTENPDPGTVVPVDPEDFELLSKVYPLPAKDFVNIELQEQANVRYQLTDMNGKILSEGNFSGTGGRIDLSRQKAGIFYLTLIDPEKDRKEATKIMKIN